MNNPKSDLNKMKAFGIVWFGQVISMFGTVMGRFAIAAWVWNMTHSAAVMAMIMGLTLGSTIVTGLIAGVLLDRFDRKKLMMLADFAGAVCSLTLLLFYFYGQMRIEY